MKFLNNDKIIKHGFDWVLEIISKVFKDLFHCIKTQKI